MNTAGPAARATPISPIRVSPNGRHFVDRDGRPVFWLGDTQWELFRLFRRPEALQILRDRQAKGFNVVLIMLLGVDMTRAGGDDKAPHVNVDGRLPWIDNDPLRPNEEYFEHIDGMIRLGEQTAQTFVVGVYHQWQADVITPPKARPWARWVARRYRDAPNLIWSMYPKATEAFVPVCRQIAAGLREGDGGAHLISVHPDPSVASSSFLHDEEWLDFNMIQTCTDFDRIYDAVTADYRREPVKPVVMAEGGYEGVQYGKPHTPHAIRKQAYWTQLAGGHHVYGHNDAWSFPAKWKEWIDAPGSGQLRVFRDIVTSCDQWWGMVPDQSILASGAGSGHGLNVAARSPAGRWIMAYLSGPSTVSLRPDAITASRRARAQWINPASGGREQAGVFSVADTPSLTPPEGWEDAVLLAQAE